MKSLNYFFWSLYALCYDVLLKFGPYLKMFDRIIEQLDLNNGQNLKILDVACGTGNLELLLSKKGYNNLDIKALDFSAVMLKRAKRKNKDCVFCFSDISNPLPFDDESFDRIVVVNVFHLLPQPEKTLSEITRVLKTNGKIILVSLKDQYQMSFILKSWKHEHEPFKKWEGKNMFFWFYLVFKSFGFSFSALKFIFVAIFNKIIDKNVKGFSRKQLDSMFLNEGLRCCNVEMVYGDQEFLFTLIKPETIIRAIRNNYEFSEVVSLRKKIFVQEFKLPEDNLMEEPDLIGEKKIDFLVINNQEIIGTVRLIKVFSLDSFEWGFALPKNLDFSLFFPCLEVSRFAFLKKNRNREDVLRLVSAVYEHSSCLGFDYISGSLRVEFFYLSRRFGIKFDLISEEFDYHKTWKIITFLSPVRENLLMLKNK